MGLQGRSRPNPVLSHRSHGFYRELIPFSGLQVWNVHMMKSIVEFRLCQMYIIYDIQISNERESHLKDPESLNIFHFNSCSTNLFEPKQQCFLSRTALIVCFHERRLCGWMDKRSSSLAGAEQMQHKASNFCSEVFGCRHNMQVHFQNRWCMIQIYLQIWINFLVGMSTYN